MAENGQKAVGYIAMASTGFGAGQRAYRLATESRNDARERLYYKNYIIKCRGALNEYGHVPAGTI